jgi:hypothetical protein
MKISRNKLQEIIREELENILNEEQVDENLLKKAALGTALSLGLGAASPAMAAKPVAQGTEQVSTIKESITQLTDLKAETYSVNFKNFDAWINKDFNQIIAGRDYLDFKVVYENTQALLKDINTLIENQENKPEEAKYRQENIKIKKAAEALLKRF